MTRAPEDRRDEATPRSTGGEPASRPVEGVLARLDRTARNAFGSGVPIAARLRALVVMALLALALTAGATVAATGAIEVLRVLQGRPPVETPHPADSPGGAVESPSAAPSP